MSRSPLTPARISRLGWKGAGEQSKAKQTIDRSINWSKEGRKRWRQQGNWRCRCTMRADRCAWWAPSPCLARNGSKLSPASAAASRQAPVLSPFIFPFSGIVARIFAATGIFANFDILSRFLSYGIPPVDMIPSTKENVISSSSTCCTDAFTGSNLRNCAMVNVLSALVLSWNRSCDLFRVFNRWLFTFHSRSTKFVAGTCCEYLLCRLCVACSSHHNWELLSLIFK